MTGSLIKEGLKAEDSAVFQDQWDVRKGPLSSSRGEEVQPLVTPTHGARGAQKVLPDNASPLETRLCNRGPEAGDGGASAPSPSSLRSFHEGLGNGFRRGTNGSAAPGFSLSM
ncbi:hypothetical protein EYF80_003579 [Liparis tanakae]|uniref:Uncharacterized protein n=1 Tax=Liparis tanakae TaxID=230148 RepID=A0A4Z2J9R9_9TELE|nr:hypothetical protein EYF80_003579 [Liparis tanakae]